MRTPWIPGTTGPSLAELLAPRPELLERFERFAGRLWQDRMVDPVLLELVRLRICQLLGDEVGAAERTPEAVAAGCTPERVAALASWPTDPACSPAERAALAVAEQFVIDAHGVTDDQMAQLERELGSAGVVALCGALAIFDGFTKLRIALTTSPAGGSAP